MKYTFEIELQEILIVDRNLPKDLIGSRLSDLLNNLIERERVFDQTDEPEMWIDVTDDGESKCNIYSIGKCRFIDAD